MARFGQIPPYGKHFRLEPTSYHRDLANRVYALKEDPAWFIRADKTSKVWAIYHGTSRDTAAVVKTPFPSLTAAMAKLLDGVSQGFYQTAPAG
jgi:hypothetical protein